MKDTKTVLPTVNGGGGGENKNGFHNKNRTQENGNNDEHRSTTLKNGLDNEELIGGCCVCSDDQGFPNNALVYCDGKGCTVACHTGTKKKQTSSIKKYHFLFSMLWNRRNTRW
jgi:hypothetical protein